MGRAWQKKRTLAVREGRKKGKKEGESKFKREEEKDREEERARGRVMKSTGEQGRTNESE